MIYVGFMTFSATIQFEYKTVMISDDSDIEPIGYKTIRI